MPSSPPELTALVVTYNHAPFIEQAIESVLMQETDFRVEIVVSEDCSTDGTQEIVRRLSGRYPDVIRPIFSARNFGDGTVVRRGLEAARGSFIALLDGDDFWTSKEKLRRQVTFLSTRPDCSACFHNVTVLYEDEATVSHPFYQDRPSQRLSRARPKPVSTLADLVRGNFIQTCSVVSRAEGWRELPRWYDGLSIGDWPLHVLNAERGRIAYLDEVMAAYRVHPTAYWSMNMSKFGQLADVEAVADVYEVLNRHLDLAFDEEIRKELASLYEGAAYAFYKGGQPGAARACARRALGELLWRRSLTRWKLWILSGLPGRTPLASRSSAGNAIPGGGSWNTSTKS